jgi:hypothetical protein
MTAKTHYEALYISIWRSSALHKCTYEVLSSAEGLLLLLSHIVCLQTLLVKCNIFAARLLVTEPMQ